MLKSISNNFGSPEITFRAAQHDRYVVLNAHFTYDPADAAYIAVQELEIKLPDLSIDKSTEAGIIAVYKDIYESPYGDTYRYHFPAVLRSRIRDRNTLCIEKAAGLDGYGPVHVYIHAMYSSLNTGELTELSERTPLTLSCTPEISLSSATHACVIGPDWAWLYLGFPYTIGQVREDMEIVLDASIIMTTGEYITQASAAAGYPCRMPHATPATARRTTPSCTCSSSGNRRRRSRKAVSRRLYKVKIKITAYNLLK